VLQEARPTAAVAQLTPRELEVLQHVAEGLTNGEIARRLDVSVHAVKFHLSHVYRKLGVSNRTEAAVAFQSGANAGPGDSAEREKILFDWNATEAPFPARAAAA
jgi:DNA-binding CsgD family transcriptional regulator